MESFDAEWLAVREPVDHRSRAHALTEELGRRLEGRSVRAVDLAAGTGSNVRYLLPRLPQITHWTLVDHDAALLDIARQSLGAQASAAGITLEIVQADLRALPALPLESCALITASALLDLVSVEWLSGLAARCRHAQCAVLFALSYDGRIECEPADAWDTDVLALVNRHQRTDKGFGPALGPEAVGAAELAFAGGGGGIARSDWSLDVSDGQLQRRLVDGWAQAAADIAPDQAEDIGWWRRRRQEYIASGRSRLRVGHRDLVAWPKSGWP
jgi:hypothetical protein